ncbi:MAG: pyrroline-5-carboxylate reductase [Pseudomonadota bacterium]
MDLEDVRQRGIVLLGCGKMGSAMLAGWLVGGLPPNAVWVIDPKPSDWLNSLNGLHLNTALPDSPAIVLIAVKPQVMDQALPSIAGLGSGSTLFVTVAAGTPIRQYENILGRDAPIIRAMPNTPAAISKGITALIGNGKATEADLGLAEGLLSAVGQTIRLQDESQMDAVTALSGSGPAYVFHLIECLAAAGVAEGLPEPMAMRLAKATVSGAGQLAETAPEEPDQLRINVTSPGGTTAAALAHLMDGDSGLPPLMARAVTAAAARSRELAK